MRLESLTYSEHNNDPRYWELDELILADVNLVVGMNASGKTRTLNVIGGLASLLSGKRKEVFESADYCARFTGHPNRTTGRMEYLLDIEGGRVIEETLTIDEEQYLRRTKTGRGKIWAEKEQQYIAFKVPETRIAAAAKRDELQHPFLDHLCGWAESVVHVRCGTRMGKDKFVVVGKGPSIKGKFGSDVKNPVATFLSGCNRFGRRAFKTPVKRDMRAIGFPISSISVAPPVSISLSTTVGEAVLLNVREIDLKCETDQHSMSDGMFRALALLIQVNYAIMENPSSCILIDDIGEGLDYERANSLVNVIRAKASSHPVQVIMASNNRFVINGVPIKEWQVAERKGPRVHFYNYCNSRDVFEEFEYTGLSNYDFFRSGFFAEGLAKHAEDGGFRRG